MPQPLPSAAGPGDEPGDIVTVTTHGWAHGGEAVGRLPDGIVVFVGYALPGETLRVRVTERRKRWARGDVVEVLEPSPHRVAPPCPHFGPTRCGGCQLQHIGPRHQLDLKARVLREQLERIGKLTELPPITVDAPPAWPAGYRAWARMAAAPDGRLGFRTAGTHDVHPVDRCPLLNDRAAALRDAVGDGWAGVEDVELIAGQDGELITITPGPGGVPTTPDAGFGVALRGAGTPAVIREPGAVTFTVHDVPLRVSAGAFFQAGSAAAEALVDAVMEAVGDVEGVVAADLYAGVGLFSAFLARAGARVTMVEGDEVAVADARHNLGGGVEIIPGAVEHVVADGVEGIADAEIVVLDPPRSGAGGDVCAALLDLAPRRVVYVACDPAALARDARALVAGGMTLTALRGLDLFGHTAHVEAVATFDHGRGA